MKKNTRKLLALLLCMALAASLLCACSASNRQAPATDFAASEEVAPMAPAQDSKTEMGAGGESTPISPEEAGQLSTTSGGTTVADPSQKIIYNAFLQIETTSFDAASLAVERLVADFGGFLESANVDGYTSHQPDGTTRVVDRTAIYTLRIPATRYSEALQQAGTIGNVISSSQSTDNITSQFIDNEARQDSLSVQEERLLSMLEKSTDMESLVALESRLSDVRYEIESIERQLRNWQTSVDYSTISLRIQEVSVYTPTASTQRTFGQRVSDAFSDGTTRLESGVQGFVVWLVRALPTLVLLGALAAVGVSVFLLAKASLRKRRAKNAPPPSEKQPPDCE